MNSSENYSYSTIHLKAKFLGRKKIAPQIFQKRLVLKNKEVLIFHSDITALWDAVSIHHLLLLPHSERISAQQTRWPFLFSCSFCFFVFLFAVFLLLVVSSLWKNICPADKVAFLIFFVFSLFLCVFICYILLLVVFFHSDWISAQQTRWSFFFIFGLFMFLYAALYFLFSHPQTRQTRLHLFSLYAEDGLFSCFLGSFMICLNI